MKLNTILTIKLNIPPFTIIVPEQDIILNENYKRFETLKFTGIINIGGEITLEILNNNIIKWKVINNV